MKEDSMINTMNAVRLGRWAVLAVAAVVLGADAPAAAYFAGGGKDVDKGNDCLIGYDSFFDADDVTVDGKKQVVECTDCDPSCDGDGEANGSCTVNVGVCVNQAVAGCAPPAALSKATAKGKVKGVKGVAGKIVIDASQLLTGSACGAYVDAVIPTLTKKGAPVPGEAGITLTASVKKNKAEGLKARKDKDVVKVRCLPLPEGQTCPAPTTSTSIAETTTTTVVTTTTTSTTVPEFVCGDGVMEGPEECDDGNVDPTDGCTNDCTSCGNGTTTAPETCDDANLVSGDGCDANCRTTGCGNGLIVGDETCDDGNTDDGDFCPADCIVDTCAPSSGTDFAVDVGFAGSENVSAITVLLDYPEGKVGIPGTGGGVPAGIVTDLPGFAFGQTNDLDHALRQAVVDGFAFPSGLLFRVHFETCQGAEAPAPGEFTCTVETAGDPDLNPVEGVTCSVVLP
jgi:cysteine-rich repeat protein